MENQRDNLDFVEYYKQKHAELVKEMLDPSFIDGKGAVIPDHIQHLIDPEIEQIHRNPELYILPDDAYVDIPSVAPFTHADIAKAALELRNTYSDPDRRINMPLYHRNNHTGVNFLTTPRDLMVNKWKSVGLEIVYDPNEHGHTGMTIVSDGSKKHIEEQEYEAGQRRVIEMLLGDISSEDAIEIAARAKRAQYNDARALDALVTNPDNIRQLEFDNTLCFPQRLSTSEEHATYEACIKELIAHPRRDEHMIYEAVFLSDAGPLALCVRPCIPEEFTQFRRSTYVPIHVKGAQGATVGWHLMKKVENRDGSNYISLERQRWTMSQIDEATIYTSPGDNE